MTQPDLKTMAFTSTVTGFTALKTASSCLLPITSFSFLSQASSLTMYIVRGYSTYFVVRQGSSTTLTPLYLPSCTLKNDTEQLSRPTTSAKRSFSVVSWPSGWGTYCPPLGFWTNMSGTVNCSPIAAAFRQKAHWIFGRLVPSSSL